MDSAYLGSSMSLRSFSRMGSSLSVLDFAHLGSSCSVRSFVRFGSIQSVVGQAKFGAEVYIGDGYARYDSSQLEFYNTARGISITTSGGTLHGTWSSDAVLTSSDR